MHTPDNVASRGRLNKLSSKLVDPVVLLRWSCPADAVLGLLFAKADCEVAAVAADDPHPEVQQVVAHSAAYDRPELRTHHLDHFSFCPPHTHPHTAPPQILACCVTFST